MAVLVVLVLERDKQAGGDWRERGTGQVEGGELGTGEQVAGFKKRSQDGGRGPGGRFRFHELPNLLERVNHHAPSRQRGQSGDAGPAGHWGSLARQPECSHAKPRHCSTPSHWRLPSPPDSRPVSSRGRTDDAHHERRLNRSVDCCRHRTMGKDRARESALKDISMMGFRRSMRFQP